MLKKIDPSEVRLGMHIHALEGAWIDHPFWKTRFVLRDSADLARLHASKVAGVWIDTSLGVDVASAEVVVAAPPASPRPSPPPPPAWTASPAAPQPATRTLADEMHQAAAVCRRGREQVQRMLGEARLGRAVDPRNCLPLVEEITGSVMRNPGAIVSLARLKNRDDYSYMHSVAVCALMVALARQLGMADEECREAGLAGLLHDLGKAAMPLDVLNKPGRLSEDEFALIRTHPGRGHAMLADGGGASEMALDVCLHHHERVDGTGYPHGLAGDRISRFARMGAVCDVYDAITSNRPYKSGWDPAESIARMASWKGHFDGEIFQAFVRSLGIYPTGSLVRLKSQMLAIVVEQNAANLISPVVKVFFSLKSNLHVTPRLVDLGRKDCSDRIIGREPVEAWTGHNLDELWAGEVAPKKR